MHNLKYSGYLHNVWLNQPALYGYQLSTHYMDINQLDINPVNRPEFFHVNKMCYWNHIPDLNERSVAHLYKPEI